MLETVNTAGTGEHLIEECKRIEEFAQANAATHFVQAGTSRKLARVLGSVPVVVGAVFAGVVLWKAEAVSTGAGEIIAATAVVLAGGLASLLTYLNPDRDTIEHQQAANRYKTLENQARRAYQIYALEESRDAFMLRVRELTTRYDELGELSPQTEDSAYEKAMKRVKAGTFQSDKTST